MTLLQRIRQFLLTTGFVLLLATATALGLTAKDSLAATSLIPSINQTHLAMWGRAEANTKNIEGKIQETFGNVMDSPKDQIAGKAKQVESQVRNAAADVKDNLKLQGKAKAQAKRIEGIVEENVGNITDNPEGKLMELPN